MKQMNEELQSSRKEVFELGIRLAKTGRATAGNHLNEAKKSNDATLMGNFHGEQIRNHDTSKAQANKKRRSRRKKDFDNIENDDDVDDGDDDADDNSLSSREMEAVEIQAMTNTKAQRVKETKNLAMRTMKEAIKDSRTQILKLKSEKIMLIGGEGISTGSDKVITDADERSEGDLEQAHGASEGRDSKNMAHQQHSIQPSHHLDDEALMEMSFDDSEATTEFDRMMEAVSGGGGTGPVIPSTRPKSNRRSHSARSSRGNDSSDGGGGNSRSHLRPVSAMSEAMIDEKVSVRVTERLDQFEVDMKHGMSLLAESVDSKTAIFMASSQALVNRLEKASDRTETVFEALRLLDEEHTALLSAHKGLQKRLDRSEAALFGMLDQVSSGQCVLGWCDG